VHRRQRLHVLATLVLLVWWPSAPTAVGAGIEDPPLALPGDELSVASTEPAAAGLPGSQSWGTLLRDLADDTIPRDYEQRDGWGRQTEIVSGVRVREKNGLPRISKRTKLVNHGVWRRYRVALHRPEEKLRFAVRDLQAAERGGLTFKVVVSARARCTAEAQFWNLGIRTGSATVQADATLRLVARFEINGRELNPDDDGWLVDLEYAPEVDRVRIELDDFDVRRVGKLDGDLADGLGNAAQDVLAEVLHGQEEKVTRRIRRELEERDARIKVSLPRVLLGAKPQARHEGELP
jgi:hypothetical protein